MLTFGRPGVMNFTIKVEEILVLCHFATPLVEGIMNIITMQF